MTGILAHNSIPAHRKGERRRKLPGFLFGAQTLGPVWLRLAPQGGAAARCRQVMDVKGAQGEEKCCFCSVKPRKADQYGPYVPGSDGKRADREETVAETEEKKQMEAMEKRGLQQSWETQVGKPRSKIQKKTPSFPLLSPEGWSLRGELSGPAQAHCEVFLFLRPVDPLWDVVKVQEERGAAREGRRLHRERVFHPEESGEEREDQSRTGDVSVKEDRGGEESAGRTLSGLRTARRKSEKKQQTWSRRSVWMMGCCLLLYYRKKRKQASGEAESLSLCSLDINVRTRLSLQLLRVESNTALAWSTPVGPESLCDLLTFQMSHGVVGQDRTGRS
ncbi:hypothetical protein D4764_04G0011820 [Takifugu flavidus]|uniref:Uncharacterized protein n=1 Tax=Takifugu flavidus TaxID=433684 RepID=A0A5C6N633_9TELE|nr:hypothetical protein D4764_04G0011820 [Takifugu flavidus]